jgi:type I site-specific restriction endonuclease
VSLQIVWKLWNGAWRTDRKPRVLYLADRNILVNQPMEREYVPAFGEGPIWKLRGEAKAGREIYFALYQALADSGGDPTGMFRRFDPDFFDLVIVDECRRGSAGATSAWRAILDHFTPATQLGMTATPKRDETVDSYAYFGDPLYECSLAQGINDGFLAPYRVRRVVLSPMLTDGRPIRVNSTSSARRYRKTFTPPRTSSGWCPSSPARKRRPSTSPTISSAPTAWPRRSSLRRPVLNVPLNAATFPEFFD